MQDRYILQTYSPFQRHKLKLGTPNCGALPPERACRTVGMETHPHGAADDVDGVFVARGMSAEGIELTEF